MKRDPKHDIVWKTGNQFALLAYDTNTDLCIDSGASISIVRLDFHLENETKTPNGLKVHSCTNGVMTSKTKGDMKIGLPPRAHVANKTNVNQTLLSVGQAADAGCVTVFTKTEAIICDEKQIEVKLHAPPLVRDVRGRNKLWHVSPHSKNEPVMYCAMMAYTQEMVQDLAMYLHACAGYPMIATCIKAIAAGNYHSWPNLSAVHGPKWVKRYLPKSVATTIGHMKAVRQGTCSTQGAASNGDHSGGDDESSEMKLEAPRSHLELGRNHQVSFDVMTLKKARKIKGLVCSDLPGQFPFTSSKRNNYIFVLYDFDSNTIMAKAIKS